MPKIGTGVLKTPARPLFLEMRGRGKGNGVWLVVGKTRGKLDDNVLLKQNCSGRLPFLVLLSLYRSLKLTFPSDISDLSLIGTIKIGMGQGGGPPFTPRRMLLLK